MKHITLHVYDYPETMLTLGKEKIFKYIVWEYYGLFCKYSLVSFDVAYQSVWVNTNERLPERLGYYIKHVAIKVGRLIKSTRIALPYDNIRIVYGGSKPPIRSLYDECILYLKVE